MHPGHQLAPLADALDWYGSPLTVALEIFPQTQRLIDYKESHSGTRLLHAQPRQMRGGEVNGCKLAVHLVGSSRGGTLTCDELVSFWAMIGELIISPGKSSVLNQASQHHKPCDATDNVCWPRGIGFRWQCTMKLNMSAHFLSTFYAFVRLLKGGWVWIVVFSDGIGNDWLFHMICLHSIDLIVHVVRSVSSTGWETTDWLLWVRSCTAILGWGYLLEDKKWGNSPICGNKQTN